MFKQNTLVAEPTEVIPTDSKSLRKAQEGLERQVADRTTKLAQANEQLRHEIKERRQAEELLLKEQRYLRHLLELQDRDRQMVSYEIHDGLVQELAAAIMQLEVFSRASGTESQRGLEDFRDGAANAQRVYAGSTPVNQWPAFTHPGRTWRGGRRRGSYLPRQCSG